MIWLEMAGELFKGLLKSPVMRMAALGLACLTLGYCQGKEAAERKFEAARVLANVTTLKVDGASKEVAANERRVDDNLVNAHKEELLDAIADIPATVPDPVRVALGCKRLRDAGTSESVIPAECGSGR